MALLPCFAVLISTFLLLCLFLVLLKSLHMLHHITLVTFNIPTPQNGGIPQNYGIVWIRRDDKFPLVQPLCHQHGVYTAQVGRDVETNPIKTNTVVMEFQQEKTQLMQTPQKPGLLVKKSMGGLPAISPSKTLPGRTNC